MQNSDRHVSRERHPDFADNQFTHPPHPAPPEDAEGGNGTHSSYGAGHPHLVMTGVEGGGAEFPLTGEVTTIGSAPDNDIELPGLLPHHARITHTETDEYVLDSIGETTTPSAGEASPTDDAPTGARLRHGSGFKIRELGFVFQRAEYADHGRPFGGRGGGEGEKQPQQAPPPDYRPVHEAARAAERSTHDGAPPVVDEERSPREHH